MKATTLNAVPSVDRSLIAIVCDLTKARLTFLVVLTTLVGFYIGSPGTVDYLLLLHTVFGTAILAAGAAALNQFLERKHDGEMERTKDRPLPSGQIQPNTVLVFGGFCSAVGMIYLAVAVNPLTGLLGAVTLVSYLFVYTPMKRVSSLNTAIGAIPGAIPPLMGWTAAQGELGIGGWSLFAILFFWQLPHFLAIAWVYRDDYAKAGYVMLPLRDPDGTLTGTQAVCHTLALLVISLFPFRFQLVGPIYVAGAIVLGLGFLICAIRFSLRVRMRDARILFFASIIYLPLLLGLMVLDKLRP